MAGVYSPPPTRTPGGSTPDFPWQPLANCGSGNPFFYHQFADDFDNAIGASGLWTVTTNTNGTVAHTAGDGGLALFTTNSSTPLVTDIASMQLPAASFSFTAGKKSFFLTRLKVSSAANATFLVGLEQTTTTPFTAVDGLYFYKATGATTMVLRSTVSSSNTDIAIPALANPLADNTFIDLGFYVDRLSNVFAFVGSQLVGYIPQSGTGSTNPVRGPVASGTPTLTTANLNVTLALQSGTASSKTMTVDFVMAAKER